MTVNVPEAKLSAKYAPANRGDESRGRWPFLRDVLVLQLKLLVGNLHNFVLIPATLGAAGLDLIFKSSRHGSRFYRVLGWGRQADEAIGLYSALDREDPELTHGFTIDAVVTQLENAIIRECEKGSSAAAMKAAADRVLDQLHWKTSAGSGRAREAAQRLVEHLARPARSDAH